MFYTAVDLNSSFLVSWWHNAVDGLYFLLFCIAVSIMRKTKTQSTFSSKLFMIGVILMFLLISLHNFTNVYRMIYAYATIPLENPYDPKAPITHLRNWHKWDCYMFAWVGALTTWIGDILVIYRCFVVWQRRYLVILFPCFLLLASFVTTAINLHWFRHPTSIPASVMKHVLRFTFPLNVVQNVVTTGLIAFHLVKVLRIIVESAFIYTAIQLIIAILFYIGHPSVPIVQHMSIPITGIAFVLIAVRTRIARAESSGVGTGRSEVSVPSAAGILPAWLRDDGYDTNHRRYRSGTGHLSASIPITVTTTTEQHRLEVLNHRPNHNVDMKLDHGEDSHQSMKV
ncbi:hypothetical protein H1R20_g15707, partial [Candolleomyces eurysporus]